MSDVEDKSPQSKGGIARSQSLTPEERKEISRNAAMVRWTGAKLPVATHEGKVEIGTRPLSCAVLDDGRRIITQAAFLRAMGRARSPKAGTGVFSTVDELPFFLQAEVLKPFITAELTASSKPIFYITREGGRGVGYDAQILPKTCDVYLKLRDDALASTGEVPKRYCDIIAACDITVRALAGVAIVALVDEATGFQYARPSDALARILEAFIAKELRPWVHTFPEDYYRELFRLRGVDYKASSVKRPQYFGHLTNDIIYARLAPKVLDELRKRSERTPSGRLRYHYHRKLTEDLGHPKLRELLSSVVTIMKLSDSYDEFYGKLCRIHPNYSDNLMLEFDDHGIGL